MTQIREYNSMKKNGLFITLEGIEGVGKSSLAKQLFAWLQEKQVPCLLTREPGGTEIAESIRHILLKHHNEPMANDTELLLMFAGRAQHLAQLIRPALAQGQWVICDRFTDASYAYQGGGRGIDFARIHMLEQFVHADLQADLTFLLTAPVKLALSRVRQRNNQVDRIEQETLSFFERAQNAYLERAAQTPNRFEVLDSERPLEKLFQHMIQRLEPYL